MGLNCYNCKGVCVMPTEDGLTDYCSFKGAYIRDPEKTIRAVINHHGLIMLKYCKEFELED